MKQWFIIVNPKGGRGRVQKSWPSILKLLEGSGLDYEIAFTEKRGHAIDLAREAVSCGYHKLIGVGGDGTNNEIINGMLLQDQVPSEELTYAPIAVGTGNDWIRTHGIPGSPAEVIPLIKAGHTVLQDVGVVEYQRDGNTRRRFFVNIAGMAYDAHLVRLIEEENPKALSGWYYYSMILRGLLKYRLKAARIQVDNREYGGKYYLINVGICKYSGGGMQFVPHAEPADGLLAVTLAGDLSKLGVLLATPYFYNGRVAEHPKVDVFQAKTVQVDHLDPTQPVLLEVDGEFLGETPVRFSLLPKAIQVGGVRNDL